MEILSKVIEALTIKFKAVACREVINPVQLHGFTETTNYLLMLIGGNMSIGFNYKKMKQNSFFFTPAGQPIYVRHGVADPYTILGSEGFRTTEERNLFLKTHKNIPEDATNNEVFIILAFDAMIFDTISLFSVIDLPCINIAEDDKIRKILDAMLDEQNTDLAGKDRMLTSLTEQIAVMICRKIEQMPENEHYIKKLEFLLDKRVIDIMQYIHNNDHCWVNN